MDFKPTLYTWLTNFIPGALILTVVLLFPVNLGFLSRLEKFFLAPVGVLVFVPVSIFLGEIIQGFGSMLEPLLFMTWGGKPSSTISQKKELAKYIEMIKKSFGNLSDEEVFDRSMAIVNKYNLGRCETFNSQYGNNRSIFTALLIILIASIIGGFYGLVNLILLIGLVLFWWRTYKRGEYFVIEVIKQAALHLNKI